MIEAYLASKQYAWAESTMKSERCRLIPLSPHLDGVPERLWEVLRTRSSYSRLTAWTRVCDYWDWLLEEGHRQGVNPYKKFRNKNSRLFKNAYRRKIPKISYEEAVQRIQKISDSQVRAKAMELIRYGLRWSESFNTKEDGVIGKGNKWRRVFKSSEDKGCNYTGSYGKFLYHLRKVGLRPHDLRKLAATHFYEKGMSEVDLCHVMGWESFETARSYIRPKKDEELRRIINE